MEGEVRREPGRVGGSDEGGSLPRHRVVQDEELLRGVSGPTGDYEARE